MQLPPDRTTRTLLLAGAAVLLTVLFFLRSVFLLIPVFALVLFLLWRMGGGEMGEWEDDDPADWWKKGKKFHDP